MKKNTENIFFVPVDECQELKDLGFKEPCFRGWSENWDKTCWELEAPLSKYRSGVMYKTQNYTLLAPTYEQAFDWVDEVFGYNAVILKNPKEEYYYNISSNSGFRFMRFAISDPFESKLEAKLECVRKLIILVNKTNIKN